jgi:hypothetical protein
MHIEGARAGRTSTLLSMVCPKGLVPGLSAGVNDAEEQHQRDRHSDAQTAASLHPSVRSTLCASACLVGSSDYLRSGPASRHDLEAGRSSVLPAGSSWSASTSRGEDAMPSRSLCPWPERREVQLMNISRLATPGVASGSEGLAPALARNVPVRSPLLSCRTAPSVGREWAAPISRATQATGIPDQPIRFPFEASFGVARGGVVRHASLPTSGSGSIPDSWEGTPA